MSKTLKESKDIRFFLTHYFAATSLFLKVDQKKKVDPKSCKLDNFNAYKPNWPKKNFKAFRKFF